MEYNEFFNKSDIANIKKSFLNYDNCIFFTILYDYKTEYKSIIDELLLNTSVITSNNCFIASWDCFNKDDVKSTKKKKVGRPRKSRGKNPHPPRKHIHGIICFNDINSNLSNLSNYFNKLNSLRDPTKCVIRDDVYDLDGLLDYINDHLCFNNFYYRIKSKVEIESESNIEIESNNETESNNNDVEKLRCYNNRVIKFNSS